MGGTPIITRDGMEMVINKPRPQETSHRVGTNTPSNTQGGPHLQDLDINLQQTR